MILIISTTCDITAFAQNAFKQGHIDYTIAIIGNEQAAQMMNGDTTKFTVKDSMIKTDMDLGMFKTTFITDANSKKATMLMDMMGNKYAVALSADDLKQQAASKPDYDVQYVDSTKVIAGHTCKKAIVSLKDKKSGAKSFTVWYDPTFVMPGGDQNVYAKIKGIPLQYGMSQKGIDMELTCVLIDNKPVDASVFTIPDGYTSMSMADFKAAMGGMQH